MVITDFSPLLDSKYANFNEELDEWQFDEIAIKNNETPDIVNLFDQYTEIKDRERQNPGLRIM